MLDMLQISDCGLRMSDLGNTQSSRFLKSDIRNPQSEIPYDSAVNLDVHSGFVNPAALSRNTGETFELAPPTTISYLYGLFGAVTGAIY